MTDLSSTFKKAVYREYTDSSFTSLKKRSPEQEHLGILGPLMVAEAGNFIEVNLKNNLDFDVTLVSDGQTTVHEGGCCCIFHHPSAAFLLILPGIVPLTTCAAIGSVLQCRRSLQCLCYQYVTVYDHVNK